MWQAGFGCADAVDHLGTSVLVALPRLLRPSAQTLTLSLSGPIREHESIPSFSAGKGSPGRRESSSYGASQRTFSFGPVSEARAVPLGEAYISAPDFLPAVDIDKRGLPSFDK